MLCCLSEGQKVRLYSFTLERKVLAGVEALLGTGLRGGVACESRPYLSALFPPFLLGASLYLPQEAVLHPPLVGPLTAGLCVTSQDPFLL